MDTNYPVPRGTTDWGVGQRCRRLVVAGVSGMNGYSFTEVEGVLTKAARGSGAGVAHGDGRCRRRSCGGGAGGCGCHCGGGGRGGGRQCARSDPTLVPVKRQRPENFAAFKKTNTVA